MGKMDTESKRYVSNPEIFADAFNYLLYNGDQVIKAKDLRPVDTTEVAVPYGNGARVPVQKYRDLMKILSTMQDENAVYVLLGTELQDKIHYAEPVKVMLYDALDYTRQVDSARRSYKDKENEGEISTDGNSVTIKLTSEEFLSGFRKEDKLMPIVTAVIYFGDKAWDGPMSIHEMLSYKDARILKAVPDYRINLISAADIPDGDFDSKFSTGLGLVFQTIKHSGNALDILRNTKRKSIDRESATFINDVLDVDMPFVTDDKGGVDMSKSTQAYILKERILEAIEIYRDEGRSEEEIIAKIQKKYDVTEQYIRELLHSAA